MEFVEMQLNQLNQAVIMIGHQDCAAFASDG